jgi:ferritin-like metal-binding protein YciE
MRALVAETEKMTEVAGDAVRNAALVASLQRLLHYKIAGYGTVAAYAKSLGRADEAERFGEYADRDEALDEELSAMAESSLNPLAAQRPEPRAARESRVH